MKLRNCPFCGGEVEVQSFVVSGAKRIITGTFHCTGCFAKFTIKAQFAKEPPIKALEDAWNRRVDDDLMERMEDDRK